MGRNKRLEFLKRLEEQEKAQIEKRRRKKLEIAERQMKDAHLRAVSMDGVIQKQAQAEQIQEVRQKIAAEERMRRAKGRKGKGLEKPVAPEEFPLDQSYSIQAPNIATTRREKARKADKQNREPGANETERAETTQRPNTSETSEIRDGNEYNDDEYMRHLIPSGLNAEETTDSGVFCLSAPRCRSGEEMVRQNVELTRPEEFILSRQELPAVSSENEILEALFDNDVVLLTGATGSGKTTQVPQFLYEAGFGSNAWPVYSKPVAITEPRRLAAVAMAERVSQEMGFGPHGKTPSPVGHRVRHSSEMPANPSLVFMTDGMLLRDAMSDMMLMKYSAVIIDEAHERRAGTDVLIGLLSRSVCIRRRLWERGELYRGQPCTPLKMIIMSATLKVEDFTENRALFGGQAGYASPPPVISVSGRMFPVVIHMSRTTPADFINASVERALKIHREEPSGTILIFLTGQKECDQAASKFLTEARRIQRRAERAEVIARKEENVDHLVKENQEQTETTWAFESSDGEEEAQYKPESDVEADLDTVSDSSDSDEGEAFTFLLGGDAQTQPDTVGEEHKSLPVLSGSLMGKALEDALKAGHVAGFENSEELVAQEKRRKKEQRRLRRQKRSDQGRPIKVRVLTLYSTMTAEQQQRVLTAPPADTRLVVFSTNIAESSLTLPDVRYVVDAGREKQKQICPRTGASRLVLSFISRASADQRAGRAGRVAPGETWRLYSPGVFSCAMPAYTEPEILRTPADSIVLMLKALGVKNVKAFPFPSPPPPEIIDAAELVLGELALLSATSGGVATPQGRRASMMPVGPRYARLLLIAEHTCRMDPRNRGMINSTTQALRSAARKPGFNENSALDPKMIESLQRAWAVLAAVIATVAGLSPAQPLFLPPRVRVKKKKDTEEQEARSSDSDSSDDSSSDSEGDEEPEQEQESPQVQEWLRLLPAAEVVRFGSDRMARSDVRGAAGSDFARIARLFAVFDKYTSISPLPRFVLQRAFSRRYRLTLKAFQEALMIREQLINWFSIDYSEASGLNQQTGRGEGVPRLALRTVQYVTPNSSLDTSFRKIMAAGLIDQLARRLPEPLRTTGNYAYVLRRPVAVSTSKEEIEETLTLLDANNNPEVADQLQHRSHAFIHQRSVMAGTRPNAPECWPNLIAFERLIVGKGVFIRYGVSIEPDWLPQLATNALLDFHAPSMDSILSPVIITGVRARALEGMGQQSAMGQYNVYYAQSSGLASWIIPVTISGVDTAMVEPYPGRVGGLEQNKAKHLTALAMAAFLFDGQIIQSLRQCVSSLKVRDPASLAKTEMAEDLVTLITGRSGKEIETMVGDPAFVTALQNCYSKSVAAYLVPTAGSSRPPSGK